MNEFSVTADKVGVHDETSCRVVLHEHERLSDVELKRSLRLLLRLFIFPTSTLFLDFRLDDNTRELLLNEKLKVHDVL